MGDLGSLLTRMTEREEKCHRALRKRSVWLTVVDHMIFICFFAYSIAEFLALEPFLYITSGTTSRDTLLSR